MCTGWKQDYGCPDHRSAPCPLPEEQLQPLQDVPNASRPDPHLCKLLHFYSAHGNPPSGELEDRRTVLVHRPHTA